LPFILLRTSSTPHLPLHPFPTRRSSDLSFGSSDIRDPLQAAWTVPLRASVSVSSFSPPPQPARAPTATPSTRTRNAGRERRIGRSEEHTSELQSPYDLVCRLLLEKKKYK